MQRVALPLSLFVCCAVFSSAGCFHDPGYRQLVTAVDAEPRGLVVQATNTRTSCTTSPRGSASTAVTRTWWWKTAAS